MNYETELEFAKNMAQKAGDIMKKYYRSDQHVEIKSDHTPVTVADKEINHLLIEQVKSVFPEHGVLGEEEKWESDRNQLWVCDPIDGTVPYILHIPTSVFSLAFVVDGRPVVAVVYNPWTDELYEAVIGGGAKQNNNPIHTSSKNWGKGVHISTPLTLEGGLVSPEQAKELYEKGIYVNSIYGLVHGCMTVAEGAIEARLFNHNTPHDIAAAKLIVEEAGGKVTDLDGNEQCYDQPIKGAIVSNGLVHSEILNLISQS